ncbi:uncharacterized protein [Euphorbia lathyris]|uniref:uncharacterized protein isoform X2 n=1 Tax=Euphorbia lathyris TaxID=212925 RepID=UPI0033134C08
MEEEKEKSFEVVEEKKELEEDKQVHVGDEQVLRFLDSMDSYLILMDSLSSTLRQGWLDLASARHSMGASRLNSALLDLKFHNASTSLQVTQDHVGSTDEQPHFTLRKWGSVEDRSCTPADQDSKEDELQGKSASPQLRHRGNSQLSDVTSPKQALFKVDDQVEKGRSRSLSTFGTLVSPKLRTAQLSFETALETLVEIANIRSSLLSSFDQVYKELNANKGTT